MKILFIGDVFAKAGREALALWLKDLKREYEIDFTIANGENATHGRGITGKIADEIYSLGVDFITLGNHAFNQNDIVTYIDDLPMVRPANMYKHLPGKGFKIVEVKGIKIGILNLQGQVFMDPINSPFHVAMEVINEIKKETNLIIIDFHAEATSEKMALARYLDGQCTAVIGTHTHVQTADEQILENGTAFISDVGMTGPTNSIIGVDLKYVVERFVTGIPSRFTPAKGPFMLNALVLDICDKDLSVKSITRINKRSDGQ